MYNMYKCNVPGCWARWLMPPRTWTTRKPSANWTTTTDRSAQGSGRQSAPVRSCSSAPASRPWQVRGSHCTFGLTFFYKCTAKMGSDSDIRNKIWFTFISYFFQQRFFFKVETRLFLSFSSLLFAVLLTLVFSADERDAVQKKTFTKWVNSHLSRVSCRISDLYNDLRDGYMLTRLLEVLSGELLVGTLSLYR